VLDPHQPQGAHRHLRRDQPVQRHRQAGRPANYLSLLVNRARMEGIVVFDNAERYPVAIAELAGYLKDGRMKSRETWSGPRNLPRGAAQAVPGRELRQARAAGRGRLSFGALARAPRR
jgi:hypothetical protein